MRYGLSEPTIVALQNALAAFPQIRRAVLYGSRAKGNHKPASDIDLALEGAGLNASLLGHIDERIDELSLPYKVDICLFDELKNPDLIEHIGRVGKIFYEPQR